MAENPMTEGEFKSLRRVIKPYSRLNAFVYKLTGGRLMGTLTGRPVMLVTMKGARTGRPRTIPLMYVPYEDGVIIVASQGGAPKNPVWFNNLVQNPDIVVQYRNQKMNLRTTPRRPPSGRSASSTTTSTTTTRSAPIATFRSSSASRARRRARRSTGPC
jgi:deazaflavin-dependent oxidoreductase (nitroreductase family)